MNSSINLQTKKSHIIYYIVCSLCLLASSAFFWLNLTNQPAIVIALIFLVKIPFCLALTYIKDREDTAIMAMCLGIWILYDTVIITCISSLLSFFLLFAPYVILSHSLEDILDCNTKKTPKNLAVIGSLLSIVFIFVLTLTSIG